MIREIGKFIVLTFLTSWILWGLLVVLSQLKILNYGAPLFMIIFILGGNAPAFSEIWIRKHTCNKKEYRTFLKNIINPKHHLLWYVFIIVVILMNSLVQLIIPNGISNVVLKNPFYYAIISLPIMIIGGGFEEIGWRGFLQPSLEKYLSPFLSTLIIGIIWAIWHLPLWFIAGTNQANITFFSFFINALALAFILAIVYQGTKSIFMCIICHALINSFIEIFAWSNNIIGNISVLLIDIIIFILFQHFRKSIEI
ncbi:MAG: CPBP family intramembrane metalloprotease [Vallitalea sp.]|jgi:membrane protease YdiL (CAAX protease family)|nr:CPBP family intramembrane metalloprotease [Vallitalea sp.]